MQHSDSDVAYGRAKLDVEYTQGFYLLQPLMAEIRQPAAMLEQLSMPAVVWLSIEDTSEAILTMPVLLY